MIMETRGIRNNNPFNIKRSRNKWLGKLPKSLCEDKVFEQFSSMEYGVRAGLLLLRNYVNRYHLVTVQQIIERFAPPSENEIKYYVNYIFNTLGLLGADPKEVGIVGSDAFFALAHAIMIYESKYALSLFDIKDIWRRHHL